MKLFLQNGLVVEGTADELIPVLKGYSPTGALKKGARVMGSKHWTEEETDLLRTQVVAYKGKLPNEVAQNLATQFGRTKVAIQVRAWKMVVNKEVVIES